MHGNVNLFTRAHKHSGLAVPVKEDCVNLAGFYGETLKMKIKLRHQVSQREIHRTYISYTGRF